MVRNKPVDVFKKINMHGGDKTVCWEWLGALSGRDERPYFCTGGIRYLAYRLVYDLFNKEPLGKDDVVRHKCDNRICCNPYHLEKGSQIENIQDMMDRDRSGIPKTVVRAIRKLHKDGVTHQEIADRYGLSRTAVTAVVNHKYHKGDN